MITPSGDPYPWRYYIVYSFNSQARPGVPSLTGTGFLWVNLEEELDTSEQLAKVRKHIADAASADGKPMESIIVTNWKLVGYPRRSAPPWAREAPRSKRKVVASEPT